MYPATLDAPGSSSVEISCRISRLDNVFSICSDVPLCDIFDAGIPVSSAKLRIIFEKSSSVKSVGSMPMFFAMSISVLLTPPNGLLLENVTPF